MEDDGDIRCRFYEQAADGAATTVLSRRANAALRRPYFYDDQWYYNQYYYYPYDFQEEKFDGLIPWFFRMVKLFLIGLLLMGSSMVLYGVFYLTAMPGDSISRPLFFDYTGTVMFPHRNMSLYPLGNSMSSPAGSSQEEGSPIDGDHHHQQQQQQQQQRRQYARVAQEFSAGSTYTPWAMVDLFAKEQAVILWGNTAHSELVPPPLIQERMLKPQQAYFVEVSLVLPESEINRLKGMFGIAVDLLSHSHVNNNGTVLNLASSVRSVRLPHESSWVGVIRKILWLIPLVTGITEEARTLTVSSFRHIVESPDYPLRHVVVRLLGQTLYSRPSTSASQYQNQNHRANGGHPSHQQMQEHQQQQRPIEVVGGQVRVGKELNRFQFILREWFYLCYFMGTLILFGLHILVWCMVQLYREGNNDAEDAYVDAPYCDLDDELFANGSENTGFDNPENGPYDGDDDARAPPAGNAAGQTTFFEEDSFGDDDGGDWEECNFAGANEDMAENTTMRNTHRGEIAPSAPTPPPPPAARLNTPTRQQHSDARRQPNFDWINDRRRLPQSGDWMNRRGRRSHPGPRCAPQCFNNQRFSQSHSSSANTGSPSGRRSAKSRTSKNQKRKSTQNFHEGAAADMADTEPLAGMHRDQRSDDEDEPANFYDAFDDTASAPDDLSQHDTQVIDETDDTVHSTDGPASKQVECDGEHNVSAGQEEIRREPIARPLEPPIGQDFEEESRAAAETHVHDRTNLSQLLLERDDLNSENGAENETANEEINSGAAASPAIHSPQTKKGPLSPLIDWAVSITRGNKERPLKIDQNLAISDRDQANEQKYSTNTPQPVPTVGDGDHDGSELLLYSEKDDLNHHGSSIELLPSPELDADAPEVVCSPELHRHFPVGDQNASETFSPFRPGDSDEVNHRLSIQDDEQFDDESEGSWEALPPPEGYLPTVNERSLPDDDSCSGDSTESFLRSPEGQVFGSLMNDMIGPFVGMFSPPEPEHR